MTKDLLKCIRCNGKGNVRKYLMDGCPEYFLEIIDVISNSILFFPLYILASTVIGAILGFFYFIILKKTLTFSIFGKIFYFFGGISIAFILFLLFYEYKLLFKNKKQIIIILFFAFIFGHINTKLGSNIYQKKGIFYTLINIIFALIQGGSIGFTFSYLIFKKNMLDENNERTKCPLCKGIKTIDNNKLNEIKRCPNCNINAGYENPKGISLFQKRLFCKSCKGMGYINKNS